MFECIKKIGFCNHQDLTHKVILCCYYDYCEYKKEVDDALHDVVA